jgi:dihydroorotase-like cyclic amidohydrolase
MASFDLVVRGATVVTPGHQEAADIGVAGGKIAQIGGPMTGTTEIAAGGLLAIPGGIDAHTHLVHQGLRDRCEFPVWADDFCPARGPRSPAASRRSAT